VSNYSAIFLKEQEWDLNPQPLENEASVLTSVLLQGAQNKLFIVLFTSLAKIEIVKLREHQKI
jgi:hypothetical protein